MSTATLNLITKDFSASVQDGPVGADEVISLITVDTVDRDHEVVIPSGVDLTDYRKNPIVCWGHARGTPSEGEGGMPIGTNLWIKATSDGHGLVAKTKFDMDDPFSARLCGKAKRGVLGSWSITFIPVDFGQPTREEVKRRPDWAEAKLIYRRVALVEYSLVSAPSQTDAITIAKSMVPYHSYPETDAAWDATKARRQFREYAVDDDTFDPARYALGFAAVVGDKQNLTSYSYPHHYVEGGKIVTCRQGVATAIAACRGARSGSKPEGADEALSHLLKHARQLGLPSGEEGKAMTTETFEKAKADDDDDAPEGGDAPERYKAMSAGAKKAFGGMTHAKSAAVHAHADRFNVHHEVDDDDDDADHDQIRKAYDDVPHVKAVHVAKGKPKDEGYEQLMNCKGGADCAHGMKTKTSEEEPDAEKQKGQDATGDAAVPIATEKAIMSESSGAAGGFALKPDTSGIVPREKAEEDYDGDFDDDESDDDEELEESGGIRRYSYVRVRGGDHHKAVGRVHSIHTKGVVGHVENDIVATKGSPVARVNIHKAMNDGHQPTNIHIGHPVAKLDKIDDLKPPSKKAMSQPEPKPTEKAAKATPPPSVTWSDAERSAYAKYLASRPIDPDLIRDAFREAVTLAAGKVSV